MWYNYRNHKKVHNMIYQAQRTDFIDILSKNDNAVFFFYSNEEKNSATVKKVKTLLKDIAGDSKDLNVHLFVTDDTEAAREFSQHLELDTSPTVVVYINGTFNRYKNKDFTASSLKMFLRAGAKKKQTIEAEY